MKKDAKKEKINLVKKIQNRLFLGDIEFDFLKEVLYAYKEELKVFTLAFILSGKSSKKFHFLREQLRRDNLQRAIQKMEEKKLLKIENGEIHITKLGEKVFSENKLIRDVKNNKKKWDGKWRMLSFDIPTDMNTIRTGLRIILLKAGFLQIQKSVYLNRGQALKIYFFML